MQNYEILLQAKQEKAEELKAEQEKAKQLAEQQKAEEEKLKAEEEKKAAIVRAKVEYSKEQNARCTARENQAAKKIAAHFRQLSQELKALEQEESQDKEKAAAVDIPLLTPIAEYRKALESFAEDTTEFTRALKGRASKLIFQEYSKVLAARKKI